MKEVVFILLISVISLNACNDRKQTAGKDSIEQKTGGVAKDPAKDSAEIRTVITGFYNWYTKNYTKFEGYDLYNGIKKKDAPPYKINWDGVAKYQQFIRDSVPQLGEGFIADQKHFFQQCDSAFKVDVEDDIPYGFDYDWYTNSQEDPQYLVGELNDKNSYWAVGLNGDAATVNISVIRDIDGKPNRESVITIAMKKENGKWTIAKIGDN
ncbi:MAG TPA: hypothetical protein VIV35_09115 [Chitinophagaceae bacterium]